MGREDNMTILKDIEKITMADPQRPGVIRRTKDYMCPVKSPVTPVSPYNADDGPAPSPVSTQSGDDLEVSSSFFRENPRELRNRAEKQRRDKLNKSIAELAAMVPPVVASSRKIDKTGVLRLTAHYLRAHQYVFGDTLQHECEEKGLKCSTADGFMDLLNGFLLTTTYRGIVVVVSQNVHEFLGYKELDLLGQSVFNIVHPDDHKLLTHQMSPNPKLLGKSGELLVPDDPIAKKAVENALSRDHRRFIIRFKKQGQRSDPVEYVTSHVEGSFRKSDNACRGYNRCCQIVRRTRARSDNPCSSGNDVVFIGVVRPATETFLNENRMEALKLEYRTRHSIDGQILQCEQRISLVTGYMTNEVNGMNAMNFMHKDDVQWVIMTLRDMYVNRELYGESCYRLLAKNGQFIYMRTRGRLDIDLNSGNVTSFICTNTVVREAEGKHFIRVMKRRFRIKPSRNGAPQLTDDKHQETSAGNNLLVKDPKQLEKEILHLVKDLPSSSTSGDGKSARITLVIPQKECIVSAINRMYKVINTFPKEASAGRQPPSQPNYFLRSQSTLSEKTRQNLTLEEIPECSTQLPKLTTFEDAFLSHITHPAASVSSEIINIDDDEVITAANGFMESIPCVAPEPIVPVPIPEEDPLDGFSDLEEIINDDLSRSTTVGHHVPPPICDVFPENYRNGGLKRPTESVDYSTSLKRKNNQTANGTPDNNSTELTFEQLLDEVFLNTELSNVDAELESLSRSVDPSIPNLLASEVQEILGTIESEPREDFICENYKN